MKKKIKKKALYIGAGAIALLAIIAAITVTSGLRLPAAEALAATSGSRMPIGDGFYKQWTPNSGTTHFTTVDEKPCNGATDFVKIASSGLRDSYFINLSTVPNNSTITDILISPCASNHSSFGTNAKIQVFYRWNGVDNDTCNFDLTGIMPVQKGNCDTSVSLLKTASSTLEVGVRYLSGTKGARVSNVITELLY